MTDLHNLHPKTCEECGSVFVTHASAQRYCTQRCEGQAIPTLRKPQRPNIEDLSVRLCVSCGRMFPSHGEDHTACSNCTARNLRRTMRGIH